MKWLTIKRCDSSGGTIGDQCIAYLMTLHLNDIWSLGDREAVNLIHQKISKIESVHVVVSYLNFVGDISSGMALSEKRAFLQEYYEDNHQYTDFIGGSSTIGDTAKETVGLLNMVENTK